MNANGYQGSFPKTLYKIKQIEYCAYRIFYLIVRNYINDKAKPLCSGYLQNNHGRKVDV